MGAPTLGGGALGGPSLRGVDGGPQYQQIELKTLELVSSVANPARVCRLEPVTREQAQVG